MITVEKVLDNNKKDAQVQSEQNDELLKTGTVRAKKQGYGPYILLALAAIGLGIWAYVKGKKDNGAISG